MSAMAKEYKEAPVFIADESGTVHVSQPVYAPHQGQPVWGQQATPVHEHYPQTNHLPVYQAHQYPPGPYPSQHNQTPPPGYPPASGPQHNAAQVNPPTAQPVYVHMPQVNTNPQPSYGYAHTPQGNATPQPVNHVYMHSQPLQHPAPQVIHVYHTQSPGPQKPTQGQPPATGQMPSQQAAVGGAAVQQPNKMQEGMKKAGDAFGEMMRKKKLADAHTAAKQNACPHMDDWLVQEAACESWLCCCLWLPMGGQPPTIQVRCQNCDLIIAKGENQNA